MIDENRTYRCDSCGCEISVKPAEKRDLDGGAHVIAVQVGGKILPKGSLFSMEVDINEFTISACDGTWRRKE